MNKDKLREIALSQVPRILGFLDKDSQSETYGCFDRYYWHYKLHDIPNARFQEAVLLLALVYKNKFKGNVYYKNKKVLAWVKAGIRFWLSIMNKNGSFNEVYPNEYSFCATAFSTYHVTEAMLMLDIQAPRKLYQTRRWLFKENNLEVSNQMAASIIAIRNISLLTEGMCKEFTKIYNLLLAHDTHGYFPEYGGFDAGYQSITLSCLYNYYLKTNNREVLMYIKVARKYLKDNLHKKSSRNTQFLYPFGLDDLRMIKDNTLTPAWMDDRYCIAYSIDYLMRYLK